MTRTGSTLPRFNLKPSHTFLVALVLSISLTPALCEAWPASAYRNMVYDTLLLMPPSLSRVLWRNEKHLLEGVLKLEGDMASALARDGLAGTLSSQTAQAIDERVAAVADRVDRHRPFAEVAFELGKLLRIAADLADPTIVGAGDAQMSGATPEFHRFVVLHLSEFPLVYDWSLPSTVEGASVATLLQQLTAASRASVGSLATAFWRDGRLVPATEFDFRSVPYAVASLGYSRGVTAASYLWLAAWAKANGDFTGYRFFRNKKEEEAPSASKSEKGRP